MSRYRYGRYRFIYVGIDFADRHDFTCVVVLEDSIYYGTSTSYSAAVEAELGYPEDLGEGSGWLSPLEMSPRAILEVARENNRWGFEGWPTLVVREIRRYRGIGYPQVVAEIQKFLSTRPFRRKRPIMGLVADRGGVGLGPIQELHERGIGPDAAVFIHGGHKDSVDPSAPGFHNVAQRNLIGWAQGLAEKGQLKFNPALPLAGVAMRELSNFRVHQDPRTAHESYGAPKREGEFDDTVYATALACWYRQWHIMQEARYLNPYPENEWLPEESDKSRQARLEPPARQGRRNAPEEDGVAPWLRSTF
jgi:hypothetical protein